MKTSPDRTAVVKELEERLLKKWRKEHPNEPLPQKKEEQDDAPSSDEEEQQEE